MGPVFLCILLVCVFLLEAMRKEACSRCCCRPEDKTEGMGLEDLKNTASIRDLQLTHMFTCSGRSVDF